MLPFALLFDVHPADAQGESAFSVTALVDAITAPDVLNTVLEKVLMRRRKKTLTRDELESPT